MSTTAAVPACATEDHCTIHTIGDTQIRAYQPDRQTTPKDLKLATRAARKYFPSFRDGTFERVGNHGLVLSRVIEKKGSVRTGRGNRPAISIEKHCRRIAVMDFSCILTDPENHQYICWQEPGLEEPTHLCVIDREDSQCYFIDSGILRMRPKGGPLIYQAVTKKWSVAPATLDIDHGVNLPGPYAHLIEHQTMGHDMQRDDKLASLKFFENRTISTTDEAYLRAVCLASYVKGGNGKISLNLQETPCRVRNWRVQNWSTKIGKWRPLISRQMLCDWNDSSAEPIDARAALPADMNLEARHEEQQLAREHDKHSFWKKVCSAQPRVGEFAAIYPVLVSTVLVGYSDDRYPEIDYDDERVQKVARMYHEKIIHVLSGKSGEPGNRDLLLAERAAGCGDGLCPSSASVELDEPLDSSILHLHEKLMLMDAIGDSIGICPKLYRSGARLADPGSGAICRVCDHCHTAVKKVSLCGGCGHVSYCSKKCQHAARPGHKNDCRKWSSLIDQGVQEMLKQKSYPECSVLHRAFASRVRMTAELQASLDRAFPPSTEEDEEDAAQDAKLIAEKTSFLWQETVSCDYGQTVSVEFALSNKLPGNYIDGLSMHQALAVIHGGEITIRRLRQNLKVAALTENPPEVPQNILLRWTKNIRSKVSALCIANA